MKKAKKHNRKHKSTKNQNKLYKKLNQKSRHTTNKKTAEGEFRSTRYGYGFVSVEGMSEDIFIPASKTGRAFNGDRVRVSYISSFDGKTEGEILEVLEYFDCTVIGTLCSHTAGRNAHRHGRMRGATRYFVIPDSSKIGDIDVVPPPDAVDGDKVEVKLDRRSRNGLRGEIIENFGPAESREANYLAILSENGIKTEFEPEALSLAKRLAQTPVSLDGRSDLTDKIIFTIDGADAKDLDDAISLDIAKNGDFILGVHIADVSEYVTPKTALDRAAMRRGTSVYFTDKVVPMLPRALSNGACSLNAGEKKYALSASLRISRDGKILSTRIEKSVIVSRVRGVYSEVNDLFENGERSEFFEKYSGVYNSLCEMRELYRILLARSNERGAMELDRAEARIILDSSGEPFDIVKRERGESERLIEQFMLAANEGVATLMTEKGLPCVYRVHEPPVTEKLHDFLTFAHNSGFDLSGIGKNITGKDFQRILQKAREEGKGEAVSYIMLRTMAKAKYSYKCEGHFGLGIERYCHFTSPIRRLSDLATHRMIKATLLSGDTPSKYTGYARRAAAAASETELRAMSAERAIDDLYKCIYMERFVGKEFDASITMITSFGIFAELDNTCEGLILLSELGEGFVYDEKNLSLYSGSKKYSLADRVRVRVVSTDISTRRVRFTLVNEDIG